MQSIIGTIPRVLGWKAFVLQSDIFYTVRDGNDIMSNFTNGTSTRIIIYLPVNQPSFI